MTITKNERKLRNLAMNDPVMHQLFGGYDAGMFNSWEDFLVESVRTMAAVKNSLHQHILQQQEHTICPVVFAFDPKNTDITVHKDTGVVTYIKR